MKLISTLTDILYEQEIMEIKSIILEAVELQLTDEAKQQIQNIGLKFGRGYTRWILQRLMDGSIKEEGIHKYVNYFKYFEKGKSLGHFSEKDIFKYKDPIKFQKEAIQSHEKIIEVHGKTPELNKSNLISSSQIQQLENVGIKFLGLTPDNYQVFKIPKILAGNHEAFIAQKNILGRCQGREHGDKISFCTMTNQHSFDNNLKQDDLYVFFNMKDTRSPYQFHYYSEQFMDKNDHSVYSLDKWKME